MITLFVLLLLLGVFSGKSRCNRVDFPSNTIRRGWNTNGGGSGLSWEYSTPGYGTCDGVASKYLQTHLFDVSPAKWIYVDMFIQMKDCFKLSVSVCSLNFQMYYYLTTQNVRSYTLTLANFTYLRDIGNTSVLPGLDVFVSYSIPNIQLDMRGNTKLYVAFLDNGFCGSIHNFTMSYLECPSQSAGMMQFPNRPTPSPREDSTIIGGSCVSGASKVSQSALSMNCYSSGSATFTGECECLIQYESVGLACQVCRDNFFKTAGGNFPCSPCGLNSGNHGDSKDMCRCSAGFYRPKHALVRYEINCEQPPGAPRNFKYANVTSTSAFLLWDPPATLGTGYDVRYTISCTMCETQFAVNYMYTNITVDLESFTVYNISIASVNNVTTAIGFATKDYVIFKTQEGVPGIVRDLKVSLNSDGIGVITWSKPLHEGGRSLRYRVTYNTESIVTNKTTATIRRPPKTTAYTIMVFAVTDFGQGPPTAPQNLNLLGDGDADASSSSSSSSSTVVAIVASVVGVGLMIAIGVCLLWWRRKGATLGESFYKKRREIQAFIQDLNHAVCQQETVLHEYEIPDLGVHKYTDLVGGHSVSESQIRLTDKLGEGQFAEVFKAVGVDICNHPGQLIVAVKKLKGAASVKDVSDFKNEIALLEKISSHPHIINLIGYNTITEPHFAVVEYAQFGDLRSFLKKHKCAQDISMDNLISFMWMISDGMAFLSSKQIVHRDLACRNILVGENLKCKISDLGLSREMDQDGIYGHVSIGMLPLKWMAPEELSRRQSSTKSDVWSFGVVCWEIVMFGDAPYPGFTNQDVVSMLQDQYRMPRPTSCPPYLFEVISKCWLQTPRKRPTFSDLGEDLGSIIAIQQHSYANVDAINTDAIEMKTVNDAAM